MKYTFVLLIAALLIACADPKADLVKEIDALTASMVAEDFPSAENMNKIVDLYNQYIAAYPAEAAAYNYMELKAKYLAANSDFEGAVKAYDDVIATFPEGTRKADALFMQAFIYENNLANLESAEAKYLAFIEQYPKHEMVKDARFAIENLSLSDAELFEKLMQLQGDTALVDTL
jgi:tetratricopeptide (TPR) repeat protein